jgi:hypothetical protein
VLRVVVEALSRVAAGIGRDAYNLHLALYCNAPTATIASRGGPILIRLK